MAGRDELDYWGMTFDELLDVFAACVATGDRQHGDEVLWVLNERKRDIPIEPHAYDRRGWFHLWTVWHQAPYFDLGQAGYHKSSGRHLFKALYPDDEGSKPGGEDAK